MPSSDPQLAQELVVYEPSEALRPVAVPSAVGTPRRFFVPPAASEDYFTYERLVTKLQDSLPLSNEHYCRRLANQITNQRYLSVFLILLEIDKADRIEKVLRNEELRDARLPFKHPPDFPQGVNVEDFRARQHWFVAPVFRENTDKHFSPETVLPIQEKVVIAESESHTISRIKIHHEFDKLRGKPDSSAQSSRANVQNPDAQFPHTYVLKTFHGPEGERNFQKEVKGYQRTQDMGKVVEGLIQFYGHYKYQEECNMILEYADKGTLEHYWTTQRQPERHTDIAFVWQNLFELPKALKRIHLAQGCHQDVTPRNLVIRSRFRNSRHNSFIKLIDFNHSNFDERNTGQEILVKDECGAGEYGAPDCYRESDFDQQTELHIPQNVDVWSLGAVFLESAVWLTEGSEGLQDFRAKRRQEVNKLGDDSMQGIPYFHDGYNMLECVEERLQYIASEESAADEITKAICQNIIRGMLQGDHRLRTTSTQLVKECATLGSEKKFEQTVTSNSTPAANSRRPTKPLQSLKRVGTEPLATHERPSSSSSQPRNSEPILSQLSDTPRVLSFDEEEVAGHTTQTSKRHTPQRTSTPDVIAGMALFQDPGRKASHSGGDYVSSAEFQSAKGLSSSPEQINRGKQSPRLPASAGSAVTRTGSDPRPGPRHKQATGSTRDVPFHSRDDSKVEPIAGQSYSEKRPQMVPFLDISGAASWMEARKRGERANLPHGQRLKGQLRARDHVFILDDSYSMVPHRPSALYTLEILSYIVEEDDPDGVELHFTNSRLHLTSTEAWRLVNLAKDITFEGHTMLENVLRPVIEGYQAKLEHASDATKVRPISVYILTDGKWEGGGENPIVLLLPLIETLAKYGLPRETVGIQFISFGNETELMDQMDEMNESLSLELDIIDRTESNGNVWKMLLGAIDPKYDSQPSQSY